MLSPVEVVKEGTHAYMLILYSPRMEIPTLSPVVENESTVHTEALPEQHGPHAGAKLADLMHADRGAWKWLGGELALAGPPTVTLLLALFFTNQLTRHPVLFTSLASSAFLIYQDPMHRKNSLSVMAIGQAAGAIAGICASLLLGQGYISVAVAVMLTIILLVPLNAVHAPGISSAMGFALLSPAYGLLAAFAVAVGIIIILAVFQQLASRTLVWLENRTGIRHR